MKKSVIVALTLMLALGVSQAYGDSPPTRPVEIVNQPVDVNVVNQSPIAVDANVAFPATLDVKIVNTEPIRVLEVGEIVNIKGVVERGGDGYPPTGISYQAPHTFILTDIICDGDIFIETGGDTCGNNDFLFQLPAGVHSFTSGLKVSSSDEIKVWTYPCEGVGTLYVRVTLMGRLIPD